MLARLGVKVTPVLPRPPAAARLRRGPAHTRWRPRCTTAGVELRPGSVPRASSARPRAHARLALPDERVARTCRGCSTPPAGGPNTAGLGLEAIGIATDATRRGARSTRRLRTSAAAACYAIGDVTNRKNLTPVAIAEGRALADRLFGGRRRRARRPAPRRDRGLHAAADRHRRADARPTLVDDGRARCSVYEADFKPMRQAFTGRSERTLHEAAGRRRQRPRARRAHDRRRRAGDRAKPRGGAQRRRDEGALRRTIAVHPTAAEEFVLCT